MSRCYQLVTDEPARVGYIFLDIDDLFCAWAAVIGVLFPPEQDTNEISPRMAAVLRESSSERASLEFALEGVRTARFPDAPSRLNGIFYFPDLQSAERAVSMWAPRRFSAPYLSEIGFDPDRKIPKFDSNWITFPEARRLADWMDKYWVGEAVPNHDPIWECVSCSPVVIWNVDLRERAFKGVARTFPDSTAFLELGRSAAEAGYSLGTSKARWEYVGDQIEVRYYMDMRVANDPEAIAAIMARIVNHDAIAQNAEKGFDTLPDFSSRAFRIPRP